MSEKSGAYALSEAERNFIRGLLAERDAVVARIQTGLNLMLAQQGRNGDYVLSDDVTQLIPKTGKE